MGFMITHHGIKANPEKCRAITDMRSPKNVKEIQRLIDGRGPSTSAHASPPKGRFGPTIELWPRGSKKTFFYMFKCHKQCRVDFNFLSKLA